MRLIGNLLWVIFGGFHGSLMWLLGGFFLCITIIGIPLGFQCFKIGWFVFFPFGKSVNPGRFGVGGLLLNIIWIILWGWAIFSVHIVTGLLLCLTILGIPFGIQHFKIAIVGLLPFGAEITKF